MCTRRPLRPASGVCPQSDLLSYKERVWPVMSRSGEPQWSPGLSTFTSPSAERLRLTTPLSSHPLQGRGGCDPHVCGWWDRGRESLNHLAKPTQQASDKDGFKPKPGESEMRLRARTGSSSVLPAAHSSGLALGLHPLQSPHTCHGAQAGALLVWEVSRTWADVQC